MPKRLDIHIKYIEMNKEWKQNKCEGSPTKFYAPPLPIEDIFWWNSPNIIKNIQQTVWINKIKFYVYFNMICINIAEDL